MTAALPKEFADLAPFSDWALDTEPKRMEKRETGRMADTEAFYEAMIGRLPAIVAYLNQYPLGTMPPDAKNLLYMALSLTEASFAVERYKQPLVINGKERARFYPHAAR